MAITQRKCGSESNLTFYLMYFIYPFFKVVFVFLPDGVIYFFNYKIDDISELIKFLQEKSITLTIIFSSKIISIFIILFWPVKSTINLGKDLKVLMINSSFVTRIFFQMWSCHLFWILFVFIELENNLSKTRSTVAEQGLKFNL